MRKKLVNASIKIPCRYNCSYATKTCGDTDSAMAKYYGSRTFTHKTLGITKR